MREDERCGDCKPKAFPIFPLWDEKAKYWSKAKKAQRLRKLCCDMNKEVDNA